MRELQEIRNNPISKEELNRSQETIIGDYEIKLQRYMAQANGYALNELYGLGYGAVEDFSRRIQAVTIRDVQAAAQKYIRPEAPVVAVVKPCEGGETSQAPAPAGASASAAVGAE